MTMHRTVSRTLTATAILAVGAAALPAAGQAAQRPRFDDGARLLPQARTTMDQAISAARTVASGRPHEVDLERWHRALVFNVDIGTSDVKVDALAGRVLAATRRSDDNRSEDRAERPLRSIRRRHEGRAHQPRHDNRAHRPRHDDRAHRPHRRSGR
jgi:uncharacterized membrane protein YkoI